MAHAYISYSHEDVDFVQQLAADLRKHGIDVWVDIFEISAGDSFAAQVNKAIHQAGALIAVASRTSRRSFNIRFELDRAAERNIPGIVAYIAGLANIPPELADMPASAHAYPLIDFGANYQQALVRLINSLPSTVKRGGELPPGVQKSNGYVFISYAEPDSEFVGVLRRFLEQKGYGFWDYQSSDRNYHTQLFLELEGQVSGSAAMLSILSPDWKRSRWAPKEYLFAEDIGKPVFLLMVRDMGPTLVTAGIPYIDFVSDHEQGFDKLDRELRRKGLI